ncbi:ethylbenzene dehydrogenase-related protein [Geoalkalibacter sp.]|uniref:ethylbenzene dehydrogenase-related protein n=1 Tax=Geoalkalibacter sp. TaxID=3041440 RepID=UPI00272E8D9A|nr:ethylbenzene dehydrogenase-related protein [Geoalkalibacter sp.]
MKKMRFVFLSAALVATLAALPAQARPTLVAAKVAAAPVIDGAAADAAWASAEELRVRDQVAEVDISLKAVYTAEEIFFLVSYADPEENRLHKPWVWNKSLESYVPGPQREDSFTFKWNMMDRPVDLSNFSDDSYRADVWYWKAGRSDPSGYSDDQTHILSDTPDRRAQEVTSRSGRKRYLVRPPDAGDAASEPRLVLDYEGEVVDQFTHRAPTGSRADIKAKGVWKDGRWTIEFARKLDTGHDDDLRFDPKAGLDYLFGVSIYGLYGEPLDPSQPTRYGQGRISELIHLNFAP